MTRNFSFLLLSLSFSVFLAMTGNAQTTILDWEAPGTSTDFQYFGNGALDGAITTSIANPNASGINTSANVLEYVKDAGALTWAGAFSNPVPMTAVDLTTDNQVCVDVHMDHIGNLALKLENSATGDNWIITQSNTVINDWETLCFDVSLPSIEAPFTAAAGHIYPTVVFFFDFNVAGTGTNVTSYLDNVETSGGGGPVPADVTFAVNMNDYGSTFTNVFVNGTFNSWCGDCDTLFDADGDGIYTGTVNMLTGLQEFKFTADTDWEAFSGLDECTVTDPSGAFVNRSLLVTGNTTLPAACFASCYDCGDAVNITFEVGMAAVTVDTGGVYLAGGGNFEAPGGRFELKDDDGDDVYTITIERQKGFGSYYTFSNGNCPDYSCKEDIAGQPCADPANFNDRQFDPVNSDTTISTCYAQCTDNTTDCQSPPMGLEIVEAGDFFTIYPTLASDAVYIQFQEAITAEAQLQLIDLTGKIHFSKQLTAGQTNETISVSDLPQGMYLLNFSTNSITATQPVVKK